MPIGCYRCGAFFTKEGCRCNMGQINVTNQELIQKSKDIHGELYHKINSLQRDLNISRANCERLETKIKESQEPRELPHSIKESIIGQGWAAVSITIPGLRDYSCLIPAPVKIYLQDLESRSFSKSEHSEIIKSFKQAINILEQ